MFKEKFKAFASSRIGIGVLSFLGGVIVMSVLLPTVIKVKKEKEIVEKEKIVYVDRIVEKIVEKEKIVKEKVKVVKTKITYPDGKIVETEIYESESEQVDRMREMEQEKFRQQLAEMEKQYKEKYEKTIRNPKYLGLYAGAGTQITDVKDYYYLGGFDYNFAGPFTIGAQVDSRTDVAITFGVKF